MTYGQKLRIIRAMKGLTQREVARLTGVPREVVSALENDAIAPSEHYRRKIETGLGWPTLAEQAFSLLES